MVSRSNDCVGLACHIERNSFKSSLEEIGHSEVFYQKIASKS